MNKNYQNLEFDRIRNLVASFAVSQEAKEAILTRQIKNNYNATTALLNETDEMSKILAAGFHVPFIASDSLTSLIQKVEKGMILKPEELEKIADLIQVTRLLKRFFVKHNDLAPNLSSYTDSLIILDDLEFEIYQKINHEQVSDNADHDLARERKRNRELDDEIKNSLNHILQSKKYKHFLQSALIVKKEDHFTVPVKATYKRQIPGTIIDSSNGGATVYLEPRKVARLSSEKSTISAQIIAIEMQILGELTAHVFEKLAEVKQNLDLIIEIDVILARAKFSRSINGVRPKLNQENILVLNDMRHPLLENPVPLSLKLGIENKRGMIITGPNAGGKTITLKTIGLAVLMTEAGLFLPSKKQCNVPLCDQVFAVIGDQQSIDNSLSTFSAEMLCISKVVQHATKHSLVVFDELGSGTDPDEGSAIAISVLQELQMRGCLVAATTHYSMIKDFSLQHPGFITAAMDFDLNKLTPTYHLLLNQAGESRALWIARHSGMSDKVIKRAQKILKSGQLPIEQSKVTFKKKSNQQNHISLHKGDVVYVPSLKGEAIFYQTANIVNKIIVFANKDFHQVPLHGVKIRRYAKDLYPSGYNLDLLFVKNWQEYKFNKDLDRGSKKAFKKLNRLDK